MELSEDMQQKDNSRPCAKFKPIPDQKCKYYLSRLKQDRKYEPYIYHGLDLKKYIDYKPTNLNVKLIGLYAYSPGKGHSLLFVDKNETGDPESISLNLSKLKQYPHPDCFIEIYGNVTFERTISICVHFFQEIGYDKDKVIELMEILEMQKKLIS